MAQFVNDTMKIEFDYSDVEELKGLANNYISEIVKQAAFFLEGEFKENSPVDTGRLRTSFETEINDPITAHIYTLIQYALKVNDTAIDSSKRQYIEKSQDNTNLEIVNIADTLFTRFIQ